jgi:hypothetical protein
MPAIRRACSTSSAGSRIAVGCADRVAVFGEDVSIRRFAERSNVIAHWAEYDQGGHFAAMETPGLFVEDVRTFFRTMR